MVGKILMQFGQFISDFLNEISKWLGMGLAGLSVYFLQKYVGDNDEKIKNLENDVEELKEDASKKWQRIHSDLAVIHTTLQVLVKKIDDAHIAHDKTYEKLEEVNARVYEQEKKLEVAITTLSK